MDSANRRELMEIFQEVIKQTEAGIEARLMREIEAKIASYKSSFIRTGKWCCEAMVEYAKQTWCLPNPPQSKDEFGFMKLSWKSHDVIWCQFCGVKL